MMGAVAVPPTSRTFNVLHVPVMGSGELSGMPTTYPVDDESATLAGTGLKGHVAPGVAAQLDPVPLTMKSNPGDVEQLVSPFVGLGRTTTWEPVVTPSPP